jgi:cell division protein ZapA
MTEPAEMTQVNVTINGRVYRMACEGGQEEHLQGLATKLDGLIDQLRGSFGEIGDQRLTVMAAIMAMDEMSDLHRQIRELTAENRALRDARMALIDQQTRVETAVVRHIEDAAGRLEAIAASLTTIKPSQ